MKYRFYYSDDQMAMHDALINETHRAYVWNGTEWLCYTELCTQKGTKCNWEDAQLIFETDKEPQIKVEGDIHPY